MFKVKLKVKFRVKFKVKLRVKLRVTLRVTLYRVNPNPNTERGPKAVNPNQ